MEITVSCYLGKILTKQIRLVSFIPAEYVYTTDVPPPYPGVDPVYPPPQPMNGVSSAGQFMIGPFALFIDPLSVFQKILGY